MTVHQPTDERINYNKRDIEEKTTTHTTLIQFKLSKEKKMKFLFFVLLFRHHFYMPQLHFISSLNGILLSFRISAVLQECKKHNDSIILTKCQIFMLYHSVRLVLVIHLSCVIILLPFIFQKLFLFDFLFALFVTLHWLLSFFRTVYGAGPN